MRPRKRIAVLGATELEASTLGVVLESRKYIVEICASESAAMRIETPAAFLILGLDAGQRMRAETRLRLQHRGAGFVMESHGEPDAHGWMACVLERLGHAAYGGHGPRPKYANAKLSARGEVRRAEKHRRRVA